MKLMKPQILATVLGLVAIPVDATTVPALALREIFASRDIEINATLQLDAAKCQAVQCFEMITGFGCVAVAVAEQDYAFALACVGGYTDKLCTCGGCVSGLKQLLDKHNVCP